MLQKRAGIGSLLGNLARSVTDISKSLIVGGFDATKAGLPIATLGLAYLLSRVQSPKAVADNAHNYAINSMLEQSLKQSKADFAQLVASKAITRSNRFHDQYL